MRIDLSRPVPGLLMALPLIAILLNVSRVPIAVTQPLAKAQQEAIEALAFATACGPNIDRSTDRAMAWRSDYDGGWRPDSFSLIGEQKWRNRPEAAIDCEVMVSCQPRTVVRRFAAYD
jgi:hypothetical protein